MIEQVTETLAAARLKLVYQRPYLSSAVWAMVPMMDETRSTMGVDKWWRLKYNPKKLEEWGVDNTCGVLYHEVSHLLREHPVRAERMGIDHITHLLANICQDASINHDLEQEKVQLPQEMNVADGEGYPTPQRLCKQLCKHEEKGKNVKCKFPPNEIWEVYYDNMCACKEKKQCCKDSWEEEKKQIISDIMGEGNKQKGEDEKPKKNNKGHQHIQCPVHDNIKINIGPNCGSGAHGVPQPGEDPGPSEGGPYGVSGIDAELIRRDVAQKIIEASKTQGNIPAGWQRWAEEKMTPQINWVAELAALIRWGVAFASGMMDYSYSRPGRRQSLSQDIIFPSMIRLIPSVAIEVDTSGSMSDGQTSLALTEVKGVLRALGMMDRVTVMCVDAAVHTTQKIFSEKQIVLAGGGGTDMRLGIEAAYKLKPRPQVLIILTDGYSPWEGMERPPFHVIVGLIGDCQVELPKWAKVVRIKDIRNAHDQ